MIRLALRGFMSLPSCTHGVDTGTTPATLSSELSLRDGRRDIGGESELSLATS